MTTPTPELLDSFRARYSFALDPFQESGCAALLAGRSVLVAAPTGAGKTVVGEFAVHLARSTGVTVFYTTPVKALSNQKHAELSAWLGAENVGLLTGDLSVRPDAPVVVMTTEVLRNMIYADSDLLHGLGYVVMDEVHYLADRMRGPVWEEVIIHLDRRVRLVALSATVSNAEEFGTWIEEVRGPTEVVVSETRPVPLFDHVLVGHALLDLFAEQDGTTTGTRREPDPDLERALRAQLSRPSGPRGSEDRHGQGGRGGRGHGRGRSGGRGGTGRNGRGRHGGRGGHGGGRAREVPASAGGGTAVTTPRFGPRTPSRTEVVEILDEQALLPAIVFIFSRAGCDGAVRQLDRSRLRLTSEDERRRIRSVLDARLAGIGHEDEEILGIRRFRRAAENGIAAHHAGMLPLLKAVIEELFEQALVKVVFATETLALGINMPARSVVLEKLSKYNGTAHVDLTPGEYTQLTGRAGRRGIDTEGHAVVLASGAVRAQEVAALAGKRTYPLRSAFHPTANMAVNLLARFDLTSARETLDLSFAQFHTDRSVVGLARKVRELDQQAADYRAALVCERGDLLEYADLREAISTRESELSRARETDRRSSTRKILRNLRRGEILAMPTGRRQGFGVVLEVRRDTLDGPSVQLLTTEGRLRSVATDRMSSTKVRKDSAAALRQKLAGRDDARAEVRRLTPAAPSTAADDATLQDLRRRLREHPCHDCPDLPAHERWLHRWRRAEKELASAAARIEGRTGSLAREFDRVVDLLQELGYLTDGPDPEPTPRGLHLRRVFSDRDLLITESLEAGAWSELEAPDLVAMLSACTFEPRRDSVQAGDAVGTEAFDRALRRTQDLADHLALAQRRRGLDRTPPPDPTVAACLWRWASGEHLAAAIGNAPLAAGDFVRHCRQIIDLLEQLVGLPHVSLTARHAIVAVRRGLVAQEMDH
jgi:ATP-dependent RNA helicase HelY